LPVALAVVVPVGQRGPLRWSGVYIIERVYKMPILLDLFSGSLSWSKAFAELPGWQCISVDNDEKFTDTTVVCDVLQWEVPERLHGSVDVVTIGVPCTAYSTANKKKSEEAQEATRVLWRRAFEIADLVLKPNGVFVAENPSRTELTGCTSRPIGDMEALIRPGMYKTQVNYCRYSDESNVFSWKRTTLWSNVDLIRNGFEPLLCTARQRCCVGEIKTTGSYAHYNRMAFTSYSFDKMNKRLWATMPPLLCRDVRDAAINALLTDF
jgi:hypothetical protein